LYHAVELSEAQQTCREIAGPLRSDAFYPTQTWAAIAT
jgi:hypothetical protein